MTMTIDKTGNYDTIIKFSRMFFFQISGCIFNFDDCPVILNGYHCSFKWRAGVSNNVLSR